MIAPTPIEIDQQYRQFIEIERETPFQYFTFSKGKLKLVFSIPNEGFDWRVEVQELDTGVKLTDYYCDHYGRPEDELREEMREMVNELLGRVLKYQWRFVKQYTRFGAIAKFQLNIDGIWIDEFYSWWFRVFWQRKPNDRHIS